MSRRFCKPAARAAIVPARRRHFPCSPTSRRARGPRPSKRRCWRGRCRRGSPIRTTANSPTTASLQQKEIDTLAAWVDAGAPQGNPKDLPPPREFADGWAIPKPDAVIELPSAFEIPATGVHRISAHPDPGAVQDRQMGSVRGGAAHRPLPRAPHHRVHPRTRVRLAEGRQARHPLRPRKTEGGRRTRTPASCPATFWWATLPASRPNASSRDRPS